MTPSCRSVCQPRAQPFFNETVCYSLPITTYCKGDFQNHSCAPSWTDYTTTLPFTDDYERYVNTTFLDEDVEASTERYQWTAVQHTLLPNGTVPAGCKPGTPGCKDGPIVHVNITRNYTFTVGKTPVDEDGRRPLLRYEWTQGMPFTKAFERDCFVFDYSLDYSPGAAAVPPEKFEPPGGLASCVNLSSSGANAGAGASVAAATAAAAAAVAV